MYLGGSYSGQAAQRQGLVMRQQMIRITLPEVGIPERMQGEVAEPDDVAVRVSLQPGRQEFVTEGRRPNRKGPYHGTPTAPSRWRPHGRCADWATASPGGSAAPA